ncbi:ATP-grasp domain-containing protein [Curtobacterium sp. PhB136]|uniref:ATP-grasp domain-containing protein n=1 Tax=Curtobacterium sp. PhB136 TaxID=2485181 RepID=UPI0010E7BDD2|nr:ATP-grasp domain-containing protein [Curtobacterium sp. PhB136]TCK65760.1 carbamoylphosphate synthase large subunit [Curtobacterium sp. PhB136]
MGATKRFEYVVVVGKGHFAYRGYNLEELKDAGVRTILVDDDPLSNEEAVLIESLLSVDFTATPEDEALRVQSALPDGAVRGICYIESLLPWAARFFAAIGVDFLSAEQAVAVRSKSALRKAFEVAGLHTPWNIKGTPSDLLAHDALEYPLIVKPDDGFSSIGVELLASHDELVRYFARDNNVNAEQYVLEGVLDGAERSLEGFIRDGEVSVIGLTTKFKTSRPFFEELGHYIDPAVAPTPAHVDAVAATMRAMGISTSPFHFEFFEHHGDLLPVEVGARPGGDKIPYLHRRASGKSLLLTYLDKDHAYPSESPSGVGIVFFVPAEAGTVVADFPNETVARALGEHAFEAHAGKAVQAAPEDFFARLGFAVIVAPTVDEFLRNANERIDLMERAAGIALHRLE